MEARIQVGEPGSAEPAPEGAVAPARTMRLLIVDDHEVVREGLHVALERDQRLAVVGAASSAEEALQLARRTLPDVAILDMHLPEVPGDELCRELRRLLPSISVVILSSYLTEEAVRRASDAGAAAYVTKAAGLPELRAVLDRLWSSGAAGEPQSAGLIVEYLRSLVHERVGDGAPTPQQRRVLELAAEGLTYREIADRLVISESTVRFHIQKLKVKFHTTSKTELIVEAIRRGLIARPQDEAPPHPPA